MIGCIMGAEESRVTKTIKSRWTERTRKQSQTRKVIDEQLRTGKHRKMKHRFNIS